MKELFKDYEKVFIRTPIYSYLSLFDGNNGTKNLDDVIRLRLADPVFLEALYWSSPQLFEAVLKFRECAIKGAKEKKLMQTLKKYVIRASTRCTPYGIYAGTGIADIGLEPENQNYVMQRIVRIDMGLMQSLKSAIASDPAIYPHLFYSINNSLYSIPDQYRFMETIVESGKCHYQISSIDQTDFLEKIIGLIQNATVSINDIYTLADESILYEEFTDFIKELIKTQFLVSELQLGLTIENELGRYIKILERLIEEGITEAKKYIILFSCIENILSQFEKLPIGNLPLKEIKDLEALLNECRIEDRQEHLFHADLKKSIPPGFVFPKEKVQELEKAIRILGKLTGNTPPHDDQLDLFKKLFSEKYETREIPLSEAMDPELGVGFPATEEIGNTVYNSLIENIDLSSKKNGKAKIEKCTSWLQDKIESLAIEDLREGIQLDDNDLKDLDDKTDQLANNFVVMGALLPKGGILIQNVGGSHANSLLGRFAYIDEKMTSLCKELSETERQINEQVIFAEIIHLPEGRAGNIARRLNLSDYEIPFLSSSSLAVERQIPINDLLVSIRQNEIILRSKRLGKRVIPRLSNAHNYTNSLVPVYKFLSSIQHQGKQGFAINWGDFAHKKRFLPRLSYRNIVLHRASWLLQESDINAIVKTENPLDSLRAFLAKWHVPRFVCITEWDNELFIDTSNHGYLEILLDEIKTRNTVKLIEWLHDSTIGYDVKRKTNIQQFILPLHKMNPVHLLPFNPPNDLKTIQRTFEPGSEWLYFKIYSGAKFSDSILLNIVKPAINRLLKDGIITKAFFIRYTDPHYHIRFRLGMPDSNNKEQLAIALNCVYELLHPYCTNRLVWKVQLDTYQREIERYGEHSILVSEELFFYDSLLYLQCLEDKEFAGDDQIRFMSALKNMDRWLNLFNMSLEERAAYCMEMSEVFAKEYGNRIKLQIDRKYRELKNGIPSFLNSNKYDFEFNERDKKLEGMKLPLENLSGYIHMSMNRWFVSQQRLMEYMAYLFCAKYYNQILHQSNEK